MKRLIFLMTLLVMASMAWAGFEINLDPEGVLTNGTIQGTQSITYGALLNDSNLSSGFTCYLYTNENGSSGPGDFINVQTQSSISNDTAFNFTLRNNLGETSGALYNWAVNCTSSEGEHNWSSLDNDLTNGNKTFGVDVTSPSVTINSLSDGAWSNNNATAQINLTAIDDNAATCVLNTNINVSTDTVGEFDVGKYTDSFDTYDYTNDTSFNFSKINASGNTNFTDSNAGYKWEYSCNDTAGNEVTLGSNYTFYIDTLAPSIFGFVFANFTTDNVALWNATRATDYTPQVGWQTVTELNFSRYTIFFNQDNVSGKTIVETNQTNQTLGVQNSSILVGDKQYFINITAWDLAGNRRQMTGSLGNYSYYTDSTNRELDAGWNIIGNVGNAFSLSAFLNNTGGTTASIWNDTHEWLSHVDGGANGGNEVPAGGVGLIYMSAAANFSDLVWNTSAFDQTLQTNISNQTNSDWNLIMNLNSSDDFRLNQLDNFTNECSDYANCNNLNITFMSVFNNSESSGSKYLPYVNNWTINNATTLGFGNTVWMFMGSDSADTSNISIEWGSMGDY